jgi:AraC-like DNA-binding protein
MAELTVGCGVARGLLDFAVAKGADRETLLARAGIDPAELGDQEGRVPQRKYIALMRAAQVLCGDPALALHYGEEVDVTAISMMGLMAPPDGVSVAGGMAQMNRFLPLMAEVETEGDGDRYQLVADARGHWLVDRRKNPNAFFELTESAFARMVCTVRRHLPGMPAAAKAVHLTHPDPGYRTEYERIFQAPVVFDSDRNALLIDAAWVSFKFEPPSRYVAEVFNAHAEALLAKLQSTRTARGRVERLLAPLLHTGEASMANVCRELGVSRQTLFRQLKAEDVTFEAVLRELRHTHALHYLGAAKASVSETAYLVGFSDPAAFSRAFKRWTGVSPRDVRAGRAEG